MNDLIKRVREIAKENRGQFHKDKIDLTEESLQLCDHAEALQNQLSTAKGMNEVYEQAHKEMKEHRQAQAKEIELLNQKFAEETRMTERLVKTQDAADKRYRKENAELRVEIEQLKTELFKTRNERWDYEKGHTEVLGQLSDAERVLEWYGSEIIWIQGRYEGGVFFSLAEDDKGKRARQALSHIKGGEING